MNFYQRIKNKVFETIEISTSDRPIAAKIYDFFFTLIVVLSCACVFVEFLDINEEMRSLLFTLEYIFTGFFILEYLVKLWVSDITYREYKPFRARLEFITSFESLIDIISILSILFTFIPKDLAGLRLLKLLKLVRLVKMNYYKTEGKENISKYEHFKRRTYEIITKSKNKDIASLIFDITQIFLIVTSIIILIILTFPISEELRIVFKVVEIVIGVFFILEYCLRVWLANYQYPTLREDKARMKYIFSMMALIDFISILPLFVVSLDQSLAIVKVLRLFKIVRLAKVSRYFGGISDFGKAIYRRRKQIFFSAFVMITLIIFCSILMYSFENSKQPEVFKNAFSGVIYAFGSLASLEAYQFVPLTYAGKILNLLMSVLGICVFAVPSTIVADEFMRITKENNKADTIETEEKEINEINIGELSPKNKEIILKLVDILKDDKED